MHNRPAQLIIGNDQHVRANSCRAVEAQFFQLLRVRHLLQVNLNVVLLFEIGDRVFNAGRFLMSSQTLSCVVA